MELKRIYLLIKFRGGGLGRNLVESAITHSRSAGAKRLLLGELAKSHQAIDFYKRGFSNLGTGNFNIGGKDYDDNVMGMSSFGRAVVAARE